MGAQRKNTTKKEYIYYTRCDAMDKICTRGFCTFVKASFSEHLPLLDLILYKRSAFFGKTTPF